MYHADYDDNGQCVTKSDLDLPPGPLCVQSVNMQ